MKMKYCSLMILCSTLFLFSCSKDGSNGVDGTNGTNGTNGANGTNGTNGKTALTKTTKEAAGANCQYGGTKIETGIDANNNGILDNNEVTATQTTYVCDGPGAIYSSWIDVNMFEMGGAELPEERDFRFKQVIPATGLTADIANKGIVLMYYKSSSGIIFPIDRADNEGILDSDADGQSFEFFPGFLFKDQYLSFLCVGSSSTSVAFTDRINNNGSAVRYVLLPSMVAGRSITDLKKMPYSEIAKLYNITD